MLPPRNNYLTISLSLFTVLVFSEPITTSPQTGVLSFGRYFFSRKASETSRDRGAAIH